MSNLAMAYLFNNDITNAKNFAKNSIKGAEKTNNQMALLNSYIVYASVLEEIGNKKESEKYLAKAETIASDTGISFEEEKENPNFSPKNILKNMFKK